jgi:hypothetical protein
MLANREQCWGGTGWGRQDDEILQVAIKHYQVTSDYFPAFVR